jgi:hypothetical protein
LSVVKKSQTSENQKFKKEKEEKNKTTDEIQLFAQLQLAAIFFGLQSQPSKNE